MTVDVLLEMIQNTDEKVEEGHTRLRGEFTRLAARVDILEDEKADLVSRVTRLEKTPPPKVDVTSLQFDTRVVVGIVIFAVSLFSANYASNASIRSDVRDILAKMAQRDLVEASRDRLSEERANVLRDAVDSIKKRTELQSYEIQDLQKAIMALKSAK